VVEFPENKSVPFSGLNDHDPQSGNDSIFQSSNVPGYPIFSTVILPMTVSPGDISVQIRSPSQFNK